MGDKKGGALLRLREDYEFRTLVTTVIAAALSAAIGVYYTVLAAIGDALWCGTLAGYYFALAADRTAILISQRCGKAAKENDIRAKKRAAAEYLSCGALLVFLTFIFSGVILLTVLYGYHVEYAGHLIFAAAFYAFFKIISAIYNFAKRRDAGMTSKALRAINAADALVSIVSLQAAMLSAFSTAETAIDVNVFNAATGGVAGVLILALGAFMIVRGARALRTEFK